MIRRIERPAALLLVALAAAACTDQNREPATPLSPLAVEGPSLGILLQDDAFGGTTYTEQQLKDAVANPLSVETSFSSTSTIPSTMSTVQRVSGASYQVAVHSTPRDGFPTEGSTYTVISTGSAREADDPFGLGYAYATSGGVNTPAFCAGTLGASCDVVRLEMTLQLRNDAEVLEFDRKFFTWDGPIGTTSLGGDDLVRVELVVGSAVVAVVDTATVRSEFGSKQPSTLAKSPTKRVSLPVSAWQGQTVVLRFTAADRLASNRGDQDSGMLIDNLRVLGPDRTAPSNSGPSFSANPAPVGDVFLSVTLDDGAAFGTTGATATSDIARAEYRVDGGAWIPMTAADGAFDSPSETAAVTLRYATPTVATICVRGVDASANVSAVVCEELAVYDPTAGYVAGSGAITSPTNACTQAGTDRGLCIRGASGIAQFGFSSKYQRGSHIPDGRTRFTFRDGNFEFQSSAYDWMVVNSDKRAQYKGSGSVNGAGTFKFKLTATDGGTGVDALPDRFRIKIWAEENGVETVIYDNEIGMADADDPTTEILNGNIRIRR